MSTTLRLGSPNKQICLQWSHFRLDPANPALIECTSRAQELERELHKTVSALEKEKQFNRKIEINATVQELKHNMESLEGDA